MTQPQRHRRRACCRAGRGDRPAARTAERARRASTRVITSPHIQKTGLALAGFHEYLQPGRILVFGESEVRYLESLDRDAPARTRWPRSFSHDIPCVLITGGWTPPPELLAACRALPRAAAADAVRRRWRSPSSTALLEDALAVREVIHGVLIDILGLGVLIVGESGIGKSECALDLVVRGHRLVADDTVEVRRRGETVVIGTCPELTRHHMEVRGLGVINIRDLFGVASTRRRSASSWSSSSSAGIRRASTIASGSTRTSTSCSA